MSEPNRFLPPIEALLHDSTGSGIPDWVEAEGEWIKQQNRRAKLRIGAADLVQRLAAMEPWWYDTCNGAYHADCFFCETSKDRGEHQPDCLWLAARNLVE